MPANIQSGYSTTQVGSEVASKTRILLVRHWVFPELGCHYDTFSTTAQGFTQTALAKTLAVAVRCVEEYHDRI